MPIRSGKIKGGSEAYKSPIEDDETFAELSALDQHYVHHFGERIRKVVDEMCPPGGSIQPIQVGTWIARHGGLIGQGGRPLGEHSVRLATRNVMRWMAGRGELEKMLGAAHVGWYRPRDSKWSGLGDAL